MPKAQASMELLVLLGVALIYILVFTIFASDTLLSVKQQGDSRAAQLSVTKLAEAADYVASQGDGATSQVQITLPQSTNFSADATYVGKPPSASASVQANRININVFGNDASAYTRSTVTGAFPTAAGTYTLNVTSHGTFVNIGDEPLSVLPSSAYLQMARSQSLLYYLVFSSHSSQPMLVNITTSWLNAGPSLSVSPATFVLYNGTSTVRLNLTSDMYDGGLYDGDLLVNASSIGSPAIAMGFSVPISVKVQEPS